MEKFGQERDCMEPLSEQLVEETWEEVSGFVPAKASKEMMKVSRCQPELLSFIMEFSSDLEREVQELTVYMFFVIYRMFEKASRRNIKQISADDIIRCYEYNEDLMESLEGVHERFLDRIARVQISRQPWVMKYIVETLIEAPEEDPVDLDEDDVGFLFLLLKSVVEVFDRKTSKNGNKR